MTFWGIYNSTACSAEHISRNNTFLLVFLFQITWARQLQVANTSYQILTIGESTYIDDSRFIIDTSTVNYVSLYLY